MAALLSGKLLQNTDFFTIRQGDVPVINSPSPIRYAFDVAVRPLTTATFGVRIWLAINVGHSLRARIAITSKPLLSAITFNGRRHRTARLISRKRRRSSAKAAGRM